MSEREVNMPPELITLRGSGLVTKRDIEESLASIRRDNHIGDQLVRLAVDSDAQRKAGSRGGCFAVTPQSINGVVSLLIALCPTEQAAALLENDQAACL